MIPNDAVLTVSLCGLAMCLGWELLSHFVDKFSPSKPAPSTPTTTVDKPIVSSIRAPTPPITPRAASPASPPSLASLLASYHTDIAISESALHLMHSHFPDVDINTLIRFLIARKGNPTAAAEMLTHCLAWRSKNIPIDKDFILPALRTKTMFIHGTALDGSPAIFFRGSLYDKNAASVMSYALAAAYCIEVALSNTSATAVTVLVHTSVIPGAPNASADVNFIKAFVQILSDNYPERLRRLVLYPFPWFGRIIWSMCSVFIDQRTKDKVTLLAEMDPSGDAPKELFSVIDPKNVPVVCGGKDTTPIKYLYEEEY